jgi:hypothetical protein
MAQDIGLLLRGLGASFSNQVPQFRQELAQQQQMERQQREDEYTRQQRARQAQMQDYEFRQAIQDAGFQDAYGVSEFLKNNNIEGALGLLEDRMSLMNEMGVNLPGDPTRQVYEDLKAAALGDTARLGRARATAGVVLAQGIGSGRFKMPEAQEQVKGVVVNGRLVDPVTGEVIYEPPASAGPSEDEVKFARENIVKNVQAINTNLGTVTTSFERLNTLLPQMKSGNRAAINAGLMSVARLISPEAVNESDVQRYSGAGNEISVLYNFLQGKGVDMDQMLRIADPLNPATFDPETLMSVARSVTSASIPSLMASLEDQRNVASQYQLSPQFKASYLTPNSALMKRVNDMMASLNASPPASVPGQPITFKTEQEARAAADIGAIPVGSTVNIVDANGRVIDSFKAVP